MDMWELNVRAAHEALEEVGETGKISNAAVENIVAWVSGNYENQSLLCGPISNPLKAEIEAIEAKHAKELAAKQKEIDIYRDSVKRRRKAERVWTENGQVAYSR